MENLRIPFLINMSCPIGDIYLKKVKTLFCVKMLTLKLQSIQRQPTCHHCGVIGHIRRHCHKIQHQKPRIKKQEPKTGKSSFKPSMPHHAFRQKRQYPQRGSPSCCHCGKYGHTPMPNASE